MPGQQSEPARDKDEDIQVGENMTMVTTSIRKESSGVIQHIDHYSNYPKIPSTDGRRYSLRSIL
jgi:hypothetical protein